MKKNLFQFLAVGLFFTIMGSGFCEDEAIADKEAAEKTILKKATKMAEEAIEFYAKTERFAKKFEFLKESALPSNLRDDYDPLAITKHQSEQKTLVVKDEKRTREIPIRVYLPKDKGLSPIVLFSHGLGGSRDMGSYLGNHWAARGYVAVFLQHPGSDDSLWKAQKGMLKRLIALKKAANAENLLLRLGDVPVVLDQLDAWNKESSHVLAGYLDLKRVGMSGHSFGAMTAQGVSGQRLALGKSFTDPRIKAAVIMSPHAPERGGAKKAFADVKVPWLLLTGTKDTAKIIGKNDIQFRLDVFPALPPGSKYELVLNNAEHSAFTDRPLPGDAEKRNPNHHRAILAITTAFWDAYLRNDTEAKKWLNGEEVRSVLEKDDQWQKK